MAHYKAKRLTTWSSPFRRQQQKEPSRLYHGRDGTKPGRLQFVTTRDGDEREWALNIKLQIYLFIVLFILHFVFICC